MPPGRKALVNEDRAIELVNAVKRRIGARKNYIRSKNLPRAWILVLKLDLMARHRLALAIEDEEPRGRGPLIYAAHEPLVALLVVPRRVRGPRGMAVFRLAHVLDVLGVGLAGAGEGRLGDLEGVEEGLEEGLGGRELHRHGGGVGPRHGCAHGAVEGRGGWRLMP